jgi:flagellar protein FlaG
MTNEISAIGSHSPSAHTAVSTPVPTALATTTVTAGPAAATRAPETQHTEAEPQFEPLVSTEERREKLRSAIQRLNDMMREGSRDLNFSMDESTDRVVITVKNANTGEIVRQIPDAALLRVAHDLENLKGVLHNQST